MSDNLIERLEAQPCECDTERVEGMTYPHVINQCIRCHSIDALEAMQARVAELQALTKADGKEIGSYREGTGLRGENKALEERIAELEDHILKYARQEIEQTLKEQDDA